MTELEWQDPPEQKGTEPIVEPAIAELRKHPGKWARIKIYRTSGSAGPTAQRLRLRGCETAIRKEPDGRFAVYARWPES